MGERIDNKKENVVDKVREKKTEKLIEKDSKPKIDQVYAKLESITRERVSDKEDKSAVVESKEKTRQNEPLEEVNSDLSKSDSLEAPQDRKAVAKDEDMIMKDPSKASHTSVEKHGSGNLSIAEESLTKSPENKTSAKNEDSKENCSELDKENSVQTVKKESKE